MNDSNRTLRFSRTSREAFGHQARFEKDRDADKYVLIVSVIAIAFVLGFLAGSL